MTRACSTICLPLRKDLYLQIVDDPQRFRAWLDQCFRDYPELFPEGFGQGYRLKEDRHSRKTGLRFRRIRLKTTGAAFSVRPAFVLPYLTADADAVADPLFLRTFGVPFWALARVCGRNPQFWYRLEVSLGRHSIVGTTVRRVSVPEHLLADEHHQTRDGDKTYVATTVGDGCYLGAALTRAANAEELQAGYAVFQQEATNVQPEYQPQTVCVDGWEATSLAWQALFPVVVLLRCFLHGWLALRSRGKLNPVWHTLSEKVGHAYHALTRRSFAQRLRRLRDWAQQQVTATCLLEQVQKLCRRAREYGAAYQHPGGHRTSNLLDRLMRSLNRYLDDGQHLHGSHEAGDQHVRAWALLSNFRPWHPVTTRTNGGWRCPAERLNQKRYHDNWLQNLLISASLGGYRRRKPPPQNP